MNILDRLTYKISKINNPQEKQMYQDIHEYLRAVISCIACEVKNSESNITERIEFNVKTFQTYKSITFYITLDNHEVKFLLEFKLYNDGNYTFVFPNGR